MRKERAIDVGIALGVFALTVATLSSGGVSGDEEARNLDGLGVVLAALSSLPLLARRTSPLAAFAAAASASAVINSLGYAPGPPIGPTVALFFVGLYGDRSQGGGRQPRKNGRGSPETSTTRRGMRSTSSSFMQAPPGCWPRRIPRVPDRRLRPSKASPERR